MATDRWCSKLYDWAPRQVAGDAVTPNDGPGRQTGFTLLEMLVVLVVLGLLVVGLAQGVRSGLTMWDAQTRRVSETGELDAVARILRTLLSELPASSSVGTAGSMEIKGRQDSFEFVGDRHVWVDRLGKRCWRSVWLDARQDWIRADNWAPAEKDRDRVSGRLDQVVDGLSRGFGHLL